MKYVEYSWEKSETHAHGYLIPKVLNILQNLKISTNANILDAGCGGGNLVNTLNNLGYKNVYGFDASNSGIELAKRTFPRIADRFFNHDVYEPNLPSSVLQKYDVIISMEVIEHLYSPKTYLDNCRLWLKDNGFLIITTPYHGYLKNILIVLLNKFDSHFNPLWEGGHIKFFSKKTLSLLLDKTGFRILSFYEAGRLPFLWKSMILVGQKND